MTCLARLDRTFRHVAGDESRVGQQVRADPLGGGQRRRRIPRQFRAEFHRNRRGNLDLRRPRRVLVHGEHVPGRQRRRVTGVGDGRANRRRHRLQMILAIQFPIRLGHRRGRVERLHRERLGDRRDVPRVTQR